MGNIRSKVAAETRIRTGSTVLKSIDRLDDGTPIVLTVSIDEKEVLSFDTMPSKNENNYRVVQSSISLERGRNVLIVVILHEQSQ